MAVKDDLQVARELRQDKAKPPTRVNPTIPTRAGRHVNAAQIVMGLAQDLNSDNIELPGYPDVVARMHRALGDEKSTARDVVKLVSSEPALAARLVQLANSAAFNKSGREVGELRAAISSLGFNVVRGQATAFALRQMEKLEWLVPIRPVLADIWKTSNGVAALCFSVAKQVPGVTPEEALSAGLFHLIGKLYLFARARQESIDPGAIADWEKALNEWHVTIARSILDHWKIPTRVAEAVENQNAIFDADNRDLSTLTRILCAAKLHYRLRRPGAAPEPDAEEALAKVRLYGRAFEALVAAAKADADAARAALT
jgi:HD-like signal output (HDOD) protein